MPDIALVLIKASFIKNARRWARKMALKLSEHPVLSGELSLVSRIHIRWLRTACNFSTLFWRLTWYTYIHTDKTLHAHAHTEKKELNCLTGRITFMSSLESAGGEAMSGNLPKRSGPKQTSRGLNWGQLGGFLLYM